MNNESFWIYGNMPSWEINLFQDHEVLPWFIKNKVLYHGVTHKNNTITWWMYPVTARVVDGGCNMLPLTTFSFKFSVFWHSSSTCNIINYHINMYEMDGWHKACKKQEMYDGKICKNSDFLARLSRIFTIQYNSNWRDVYVNNSLIYEYTVRLFSRFLITAEPLRQKSQMLLLSRQPGDTEIASGTDKPHLQPKR